jgi:tRNA(Ile)-lysidine synthase
MPDLTPSPERVERCRTDLEALVGDASGRLGVAVSGGPDSLALLLLAKESFPGRVEAATVDHGLRPESADEAAFVASLCARLLVPHALLRPTVPITGNLQSSARRARYALLEQWRQDRSLDWVLTAHHADDQAETLLMRLNRGAGVAGLGGVRGANARVLRPLLGWRRSELAEIVAEAGIEAVVDPSNAEERFDRVRIRRQMSEVEWIDPAALVRSAQALAEADQALDWTTNKLADERILGAGPELELDPSGLPSELRRRLVLRILRRIEPDAAPRGDELSRLLATLEKGGTATLAEVKAVGGVIWRFQSAPPRRSG